MKQTLILPTIIIVISISAGIVYLMNKDYKMATYWISAGVLNASVTYF